MIRSNGLPLPEKQGVGSSILPLATGFFPTESELCHKLCQALSKTSIFMGVCFLFFVGYLLILKILLILFEL